MLLYAKGTDHCREKCLSILNEKMCDITNCLTGMQAFISKDFNDVIGIQGALLDMPLLKMKVTVKPKTATFTTTSMAPLRKT